MKEKELERQKEIERRLGGLGGDDGYDGSIGSSFDLIKEFYIFLSSI